MVVVGDLDLVRPLRAAGARIAVVAERGAPVRFSRDVDVTVNAPEPYDDDSLIEVLERAARGSTGKLPLFYEEDRELLAISRYRDRLAQHYQFVIADHELVVDLVDKARFQRLAQRLGLPVPAGDIVRTEELSRHRLVGPAIVKPLNRSAAWREQGVSAKAVQVTNQADLHRIAQLAQASFPELLVQQLVPGGEDHVESYHVYVDDVGEIAGEFTGRKIRTYPLQFGYTTALETTAETDVVELGREVVRRVGLRGVAKLDFKRDDQGQLWLLEINPRFNLWHRVGAAAGLNLPAVVLADLTGTERPAPAEARPGVRWTSPIRDFRAARAQGWLVPSWIWWSVRCDTFQTMSLRDPLPFLRGAVWQVVHRGLPVPG